MPAAGLPEDSEWGVLAATVVVLSTVNVFEFGAASGGRNHAHDARQVVQLVAAGAQMERWCLRPRRLVGKTRIVLILPSSVYGPQRQNTTELPAKLASDGAFAWISEGRGLANYVYIA